MIQPQGFTSARAPYQLKFRLSFKVRGTPAMSPFLSYVGGPGNVLRNWTKFSRFVTLSASSRTWTADPLANSNVFVSCRSSAR